MKPNNHPRRIGLIHALRLSINPINQAFADIWPQAQLMNLLDDSLSADLAAQGRGLDEAMHQRFITLADYAVAQSCDALLFTCSAFGSCVDTVAQRYPDLPVLKPNEAMIDETVNYIDATIGLIASFAPTLDSMPAEFPKNTKIKTALAVGALDALNQGDGERHDQLIVAAARELVAQGCGVIALTQFSMARATDTVQTAIQRPTLSTPASAVRALQKRLNR